MTDPAAAPVAPVVPAAPAAPAPGVVPPSTEWHAGIADPELRGYVQTKGFKDPAALAESYRNFEKLQGVPQDRIVKLPERSDDTAAMDAIYTRLGKPADATGYALTGDAALIAPMGEAMHKAGLNPAQAKLLNDAWNAEVGTMIATADAERKTQDAADMVGLRAEWGDKFDQNSELARRASKEFGLADTDFDLLAGAIGSSKTMKLFQAIGAKAAEPVPFDPARSVQGGALTAEAAGQRITQLSGDKDWTARYLAGGVAEREEMAALHKIKTGSR